MAVVAYLNACKHTANEYLPNYNNGPRTTCQTCRSCTNCRQKLSIFCSRCMHICDSLSCNYDCVSLCLCQYDSAKPCNLAFLLSALFHVLTSIPDIKAMQTQHSAREQYTNAVLQTHSRTNNQRFGHIPIPANSCTCCPFLSLPSFQYSISPNARKMLMISRSIPDFVFAGGVLSEYDD